MLYRIGGMKVATLGDPHLGRAFIHDVPLHRRGDREKMVWAAFEESLRSAAEDPAVGLHVCMGDLFDRIVVPFDVVLRAAELYLRYSRREDLTFVVLRGNHDASRDVDRRSAFDIFEAIVAQRQRIQVVKDQLHTKSGMLFVPWHPFRSAQEMVADQVGAVRYDAVFGHWEVERVPGENRDLIPIETLSRITNRAFTGHVHLPREFESHGVDVTATGSISPYAHGEDPTGALYRTMSLAEVMERLSLSPDVFRSVCLRIDARIGDEIPEIDCLQLKIRWDRGIGGDDVDVGFLNFDMNRIFGESMAEAGVSQAVVAKVRERFDAARLT